MLQIGVHHDYGIAARGVETGRERDLMAEISGERIDEHCGVARCQRVQSLQSFVPAAVIDENDAMIQTVERFQGWLECFVESLDDIFLVIAGGDDAEDLGFIGHRSSSNDSMHGTQTKKRFLQEPFTEPRAGCADLLAA